jgi:hypothetical protein
VGRFNTQYIPESHMSFLCLWIDGNRLCESWVPCKWHENRRTPSNITQIKLPKQPAPLVSSLGTVVYVKTDISSPFSSVERRWLFFDRS